MRLRAVFWIGFAMLAGCAQGPSDTDFVAAVPQASTFRDALIHAQLYDYAQSPKWSTVPRQVYGAYAYCAADWLMSYATLEERSRLDAYAQGEKLQYGEAKQIIKAWTDRAGDGLTPETIGRLAPFCPDKIATFREYGLPRGAGPLPADLN